MNRMAEKLGLKDMNMLKKDESFMNPEHYSDKVVHMSKKLDWSASPNILQAEKLAIQNKSNKMDFSMKTGFSGANKLDMMLGKPQNSGNNVVPMKTNNNFNMKDVNMKAGMLSMNPVNPIKGNKPVNPFANKGQINKVSSFLGGMGAVRKPNEVRVVNPFSQNTGVDRVSQFLGNKTPKNPSSLKKKVGINFNEKIGSMVGFNTERTAWTRLNQQKGLKPFGNQDGDYINGKPVYNILDCNPLDKMLQGPTHLKSDAQADYEINMLEKELEKKVGTDIDKGDLSAEYDRSLTYAENKEILSKKYGQAYSNILENPSKVEATYGGQYDEPMKSSVQKLTEELEPQEPTPTYGQEEQPQSPIDVIMPKKVQKEKAEGGYIPVSQINTNVETYNDPSVGDKLKSGAGKVWTGLKKTSVAMYGTPDKKVDISNMSEKELSEYVRKQQQKAQLEQALSQQRQLSAQNQPRGFVNQFLKEAGSTKWVRSGVETLEGGKPKSDIEKKAETEALRYMVKTMIRQREKDKYGFGSKAKKTASKLTGSSSASPFGTSQGLIGAAQGGAIGRAENLVMMSRTGRSGGYNMIPQQGTGSGFMNMLGNRPSEPEPQYSNFEQVQYTQTPEVRQSIEDQMIQQRRTAVRQPVQRTTSYTRERPSSPEGYTYSPYSNRPVTYVRGPYKRKFATDNQPQQQAYPMPPQQQY